MPRFAMFDVSKNELGEMFCRNNIPEVPDGFILYQMVVVPKEPVQWDMSEPECEVCHNVQLTQKKYRCDCGKVYLKI